MDGLIHIYCGEGKGKTTAAVGLSVRASGCGKRVVFAQFLKSRKSGERTSLALLPGVTLTEVPECVKFTFRMTEQEKLAAAELCGKQLEEAFRLAQGADLLVLDEAVGAVAKGLLEERTLLEYLRNKPKNLEVVLTGRNPSEELCEAADYISEIRKIKHPYDKGIPARRGIEF